MMELKNMNEEKNRERMQTLSHDIQKMGKLKKIKSKMFDYYEYNDYLKKMCEYNIRSVLQNYYNGKEITDEEMETIKKYLFFSSCFYTSAAKPDGPSLYDWRLRCCFGSGDFDDSELELIHRINEEKKQNNKKR